jgi:predicted AlkP superfamily phosphohydrolase/phosphomutase
MQRNRSSHHISMYNTCAQPFSPSQPPWTAIRLEKPRKSSGSLMVGEEDLAWVCAWVITAGLIAPGATAIVYLEHSHGSANRLPVPAISSTTDPTWYSVTEKGRDIVITLFPRYFISRTLSNCGSSRLDPANGDVPSGL